MKNIFRTFMLLMVMAMVLAFNIPLALAADTQIPRKEAGLQSYPVAETTTIYKGALVCVNTSGYLVPAADTAGYRFKGIAYEQVDNSSGSNGDLNCRVHTGDVHQLACSSITQAMVGQMMYVVDDSAVDDTATNFIAVGRLVQYDSATSGWVDISQRGLALDGAGESIHLTITGEGYSLNLINVISTCTVGEGTRGLRVNVTTSDAIASGDLQCFHGFLTLGAGASLAANAAVYPLSGWLDIPDGTSIGNGCLVAGCRVIVDPNNNDMSGLGGGGESALFYGQTWASTGKIEHGLRLVAGAGTTIKNGISIGGGGTVGQLFDFTEAQPADSLSVISGWGATDAAHGRHPGWYMGRQTTRAGIFAEVPVTCGLGSLYFSTGNGEAYMRVGNAGAATDWEVINHEAAETG